MNYILIAIITTHLATWSIGQSGLIREIHQARFETMAACRQAGAWFQEKTELNRDISGMGRNQYFSGTRILVEWFCAEDAS